MCTVHALVHTFNSEYFHQCAMGIGAYLKIRIFRWVRMPVGKDLSAFMQIINYRHAKSPTEILLQKVCWDAFVLKYGKNNLTTFLVFFFFFKSSFHDILKRLLIDSFILSKVWRILQDIHMRFFRPKRFVVTDLSINIMLKCWWAYFSEYHTT